MAPILRLSTAHEPVISGVSQSSARHQGGFNDLARNALAERLFL
jgi:hypothetical protein